MSEPLGIARELYLRREALIARMSPTTRARVFPALFPVSYYDKKPRHAVVKHHLARPPVPVHNLPAAQKAYIARANATLIIDTCARHWDVPVSMLYDAARLQLYVLPRRAAMALMRDVLGLSLSTIGFILGHRDHTTVLYGLARHEETYEARRDYAAKYDAAEAELKGNGATLDTAPADGDADGSNELPSRASSVIVKRVA